MSQEWSSTTKDYTAQQRLKARVDMCPMPANDRGTAAATQSSDTVVGQSYSRDSGETEIKGTKPADQRNNRRAGKSLAEWSQKGPIFDKAKENAPVNCHGKRQESS